MPCRECGESAKEKHGGVCSRLSYDDDGTARYECLDCVIEAFENADSDNEEPSND